MFPSSGYFRGVNCPFYASGLCERPYCHFRHAKVEEKKEPLRNENGPSYSTSGPSSYSSAPYTSGFGPEDVERYSTSEPAQTSGAVEAYSTSGQSSAGQGFLPCPIPSFSGSWKDLPQSGRSRQDSPELLPPISGLPKARVKEIRGSSAPSYEPTPKVKIQPAVKNGVPTYQPTPKSKHGEGRARPSHSLEYDPVSNFAFQHQQDSEEEDESASKVSASESVRGANGCHQGEASGRMAVASEEEEGEEEDVSTQQEVEDADGGENSAVLGDGGDTESSHAARAATRQSSTAVPSYAELLTPSSYFKNALSGYGNGGVDKPPDSKSPPTSVRTRSVDEPRSRQQLSVNRSVSHNGGLSGNTKKTLSQTDQAHNDSRSSSKSHHSSLSSSSSSSSSAHVPKQMKSETGSSSKKSSVSQRKSVEKKSLHTGRGSTKVSNSSSSSSSSGSKTSSSSSSSKSGSKTSSSSSSLKTPHLISSSKECERRRPSTSDSHHRSHSGDRAAGDTWPSGEDDKGSSKVSGNQSSSSSSHWSKSRQGGRSAESGRSSSEVRHGSSKGKHGHSSSSHLDGQRKEGKSPRHKDPKVQQNGGVPEVKTERGDTAGSEGRGQGGEKVSKKVSGSQYSSVASKGHLVKKEGKESSVRPTEKMLSQTSKTGSGNTDRKVAGKSVSSAQRRVSQVNSHLFGDNSALSGSDSDVEIVEPPPQPPPEILELSDDSDNEDSTGGFPDDVDLGSDSDTFDECLRIFQENERKMAREALQKKVKLETFKEEKTDKSSKTSKAESVSAVGKKRMAHKAASQVCRPAKAAMLTRPRMSPAEVMHNRIVEMQKRALLRAARREGREAELPSELSQKSVALTTKSQAGGSPSRSGSSAGSLSAAAATLITHQRKREAHHPGTPTKATPTQGSVQSVTRSPRSFYAKDRKLAGQQMHGTTSSVAVPPTKQVTVATTASKTEKRKAHEPTMVNLSRPIIPAEPGAKVPTNVRQRYLNLIIDEFLKFCPEETAYSKAQEEEVAVYGRSTNKNIYLRLAVNCIKRVRTDAAAAQPSSSKKPCPGLRGSNPSSVAQSHAATLGGALAARTSYTLNRLGGAGRSLPQDYKGAALYQRLEKYVLTEQQLRDNGYPRPDHDAAGKVRFYKTQEQDTLLKDNERVCRRCGHRFYVDQDGTSLGWQECVYHYGNAYKKKYAGSIDSRYACCNERAGTKGCQMAKFHVHERNKSNLTGYMTTLPAAHTSDKDHKVLSLDCEMVYTKAGLELARVTVIGDDCGVVYESLVRPDTDILDYNTRFSGITESDMRGVTTTLRGVQAVMLSMVSDKTILMGHSLESDLVALKLVHSTVVDTSIAFPHRLGLPYKRALRHLMVDFLQKIIQADEGGHDSKEDAVSCMQLMLYKVKEDAKREVRRV
ncbi:RNA exonuclease 1 homolog, partial [Aplysia californica]|uniref:RNA exonuclease 1 homolog n=1 Tax=Aplysia californica TaxID=6500 RepID=A0ABM0ZZG6_APLCA